MAERQRELKPRVDVLGDNPQTGAGRLPNFLIIGAAKSGTTSLARYLSQHPDVYILEASRHFVAPGIRLQYGGPNADAVAKRTVWRREDYERMFAGWKGEKAVGEKDAVYLSSETAPRAIFEAIPRARLIAILRHPADRAHSQFTHNLRALCEPSSDFRDALQAEAERKRCGWTDNYFYRERGRYAEQLQRYYALFPPEQLLVLLYDDLVADAAGVMRKVCRHIGVSEEHGLNVAERYNISEGVPTSGGMHRLLTQEGFLKSALRTVIPSSLQKRLWWALYRKNLRPVPKLDPHLRSELVEEFTDEIRELAKLIDRDLSAWLVR